jgi:hypothetical protein
MITKEEAYKKIADLVERFTDQFHSYKKSDYNETLTRRDFIDPFFNALGWCNGLIKLGRNLETLKFLSYEPRLVNSHKISNDGH